MSDFGELASRVYELEGRLPPELRGDGPVVSGNGEVGSMLTCSPVGPDGTTYEVAAADAGTSITCTVTATNPHGTLAAPSSAVEIPGAAAMSASASSTRSASASSSHSSSRSKE
jgi:hypothetical protein